WLHDTTPDEGRSNLITGCVTVRVITGVYLSVTRGPECQIATFAHTALALRPPAALFSRRNCLRSSDRHLRAHESGDLRRSLNKPGFPRFGGDLSRRTLFASAIAAVKACGPNGVSWEPTTHAPHRERTSRRLGVVQSPVEARERGNEQV